MKKKIFYILIFLLASMVNCTPFKGGAYFNNYKNVNVNTHYFHENGKYESYNQIPSYTKKLIGKGTWQKKGNKIIVTLDSMDSQGVGETGSSLSVIYQFPFFSRKKMTTYLEFDSIRVKAILYQLE